MSSEAVAAVRDPEEWLTPEQVAGELVCSVDYVWQLCREGKIKRRRKGRNYLIKRRHSQEYADSLIEGGQ